VERLPLLPCRAETMMDEDPIEVEIDEDDDEWISDPWNEPEEYEVLEQVAAWRRRALEKRALIEAWAAFCGG
jgi:hypothetical protein